MAFSEREARSMSSSRVISWGVRVVKIAASVMNAVTGKSALHYTIIRWPVIVMREAPRRGGRFPVGGPAGKMPST
jgi:hypothetical protein